ncbi:MAG TPA: DNA mismatch repair protein MutT [Microbacteriaceae bacterium]|jgi:predicted NUDIX family NTP pyrophosphohydrolase|nr:DNA mismatch repair protein MutT [Microbacteriaceae bacterium]
MTRIRSAGILLHRPNDGGREVWIAHMGGPFWSHKDKAAWSIPKGEYDETEDPLTAALREFGEEIGAAPPRVDYVLLGDFRQSSGKIVTAFTAETDFAIEKVVSNTFALEWPPHSGAVQQFPEIDDARWVPLDEARVKLVRGQLPILDALEASFVV